MAVFRKRTQSYGVSKKFSPTRNKVLLLIALVLLAIAAWLANGSPTEELGSFLVAKHNLANATSLDDSSVESLALQLGQSSSQYLSGDNFQSGTYFLTKPVSAGELIPISSIASSRETHCTPMVIGLGSRMASGIKVGNEVDIWADDPSELVASVPFEVAVAAELLEIREDESALGQRLQNIEVCVSVAEVRSVVEAIAKKDTVVAVRSSR